MSDENDAQCPVIETDNGVIFGLEASTFFGLALILFCVCLFCVISVFLCLYKSDNNYYRNVTHPSRMNGKLSV